MIGFAIAIFGASLLGSLHCVGMCGPFALWATGQSRSAIVISSYHLGRLSTYLSAGLVAGVIGSTVTVGGELAGLQSLGAKLAGVGLVIVGIVQIARRIDWSCTWAGKVMRGTSDRKTVPDFSALKPSRVAGFLHAAKPLIATKGPIGRAYMGGLLTTWLPCGWLYLFVLVAGGTGNVISALVVMTAFWVGTLPALTGLVYGAGSLALRFRNAIPTATSVLLIVTGIYTATGRAAADLSTMMPDASLMESAEQFDDADLGDVVQDLGHQSLPCCSGPESLGPGSLGPGSIRPGSLGPESPSPASQPERSQ